jgi:hypothetical protein
MNRIAPLVAQGARLAAACALTLALLPAQAAVVEGTSPAGVRYASGGVSDEELSALRARFPQYTLRVETAAKTGAHLAAVQARILDARGRALLEHQMEGPWLLAQLPPGKYTLELRYPGGGADAVQRRTVTVGHGSSTALTVYFDTGEGKPAAGTTALR